MKYKNFETVFELDTDTQRRLLEQGTHLEKLWAAWSLGLKSDETLPSSLVSEIQKGPTPAIRAQFIIVLADKGERSILEVLAKYDPDPSMRETACRYLYRTPAQDQRLQEFLIERLFEDESPIVRRYILQSAMGGFPVLDWNQVQRLLSDVDDDIQAAAFGLISQYDYGWILQDLPVETGVAVVRDAFFDWLLWETGYQVKETIEAEIEGRRTAYVYSQRLVKIAMQLPDVEIAYRSGWIKDMQRPDRRPTNNEERKDALTARMGELDREQAIDFVT